MTDIPLITPEDEKFAITSLNEFYQDHLIPAEKKTYLTEHSKSIGPYLGIKTDQESISHYLMDAASQIATIGLGFNNKPFWGTSHFLESWLNNSNSETFKKIRASFESLLTREASLDTSDITFCNSGAEANEIALGYAYQRRLNKNANKVLAFEGSFHGRMLVSLFSTWNKSKREPYQLPGFETTYCRAPELNDSQIVIDEPKDWKAFWEASTLKETSKNVPSEWMNDKILKEEVLSLLNVREQLETQQIFAIIIEPMQCEGGDRYLSSRFFNALCLLAKNYQVEIICDEVQTGFHLGRQFFWHRQFDLKDSQGKLLSPDYIVCAKKAQVGLVIATNPYFQRITFEKEESFSVSSLIRGYLHALSLSNLTNQILNLEKLATQKLEELVSHFPDHLSRPRACGLSFALDLKDPEMVSAFIGERFNNGLLYYPAGSQTLRFRLNTAFRKEEILFLFERLENICNVLFNKKKHQPCEKVKTSHQEPQELLSWQKLLLKSRLASLTKSAASLKDNAQKADSLFTEQTKLKLTRVTKENFHQFKDSIIELEKQVYEPTRQTDIKHFEVCATSETSFCYVAQKESEIAAIVFSSNIQDHPLERGVRLDKDFHQKSKALYMIDTTVSPKFRGNNLGLKLKYLMTLHAMSEGIEYIKGRNRQGLAYDMLSINLSMGSFEQFYLEEDYLDFKENRAVSYYQTPLRWEKPQLNMHSSTEHYLSIHNIDENFIEENIFKVNNKVCLSNFVNTDFLTHLKDVLNEFPKEIQHGYSASGQSESIDKIAKSIFYHKKDSQKSLTFKGHFFGNGSFLSRSLSYPDNAFFSVECLDHPTQDNMKTLLLKIEDILKKEKLMAIWLEPIRSSDYSHVPLLFLKELRKLCRKYETPLVFNETNSRDFSYTKDTYMASSLPELCPDAALCFLGGQASVVALNENFFVSKPLMMISTWDGDEYSFRQFVEYKSQVKNLNNREELLKQFEAALRSYLTERNCILVNYSRAKGSFTGKLPLSEQSMFKQVGSQWLFSPSYNSMKEFIERYHD